MKPIRCMLWLSWESIASCLTFKLLMVKKISFFECTYVSGGSNVACMVDLMSWWSSYWLEVLISLIGCSTKTIHMLNQRWFDLCIQQGNPFKRQLSFTPNHPKSCLIPKLLGSSQLRGISPLSILSHLQTDLQLSKYFLYFIEFVGTRNIM